MATSVKKKQSLTVINNNLKMCFQETEAIKMASGEVSWPTPMKAIGAQNLLTMPGGVTFSGYLHKKGGTQIQILKWPLRFVIIHKGCIYYFKASTSASPQGAFSLNGYNRVMRAAEETTSSNVFPFKIVHFSKKHRTWYFSAACEEERKKWMLCLRKEIDYYHEKRENQAQQSVSGSDSESFYGSVERLIDIKYIPETSDDDNYEEEEEEEEEKYYLKPDESQEPNILNRPDAPPPAYPPPPVPLKPYRHETPPQKATGIRAMPPNLPPTPKKGLPQTQFPRKESPPFPEHKRSECELPKEAAVILSKGPPPQLPFASHLKKPATDTKEVPVRSPTPSKFPKALPICSDLEKKLAVSNKPSHATLPLLSSIEKKLPVSNKPSHATFPKTTPPQNPNLIAKSLQCEKPGMYKPPLMPKTLSAGVKPKPKPKHQGQSLQRSSPDGQSFRSSVDEEPAHMRTKSQSNNYDSDEDYEKVQLPNSVFVSTTDTSEIERLFKDTDLRGNPQDGLYCIRNSTTRTTKVLVVWDATTHKTRNYRIFEKNSRVFLENDLTFPSFEGLVDHYYSHVLPSHDTLRLQKPYGCPVLR
ncbi:SH3 domain-binding protein 2-like [Acipenser oxyrinchus oxyrinchus]|uniref:SH3 domain-binding protein 2 n=1 Tax=Acipenser oxyrinchus oxyrinchus TaxID=40147 RepID=A0AAD8LUB6_ACIOX|nr:SH3 domain-binding protein 2-like [Acipenser oxyrinchus oxyrinchus]